MNPRRNIIRMLLAALVFIVICCILLSLSNCLGTPGNSSGKPAAGSDNGSIHSKTA